MAAVCDLPSTRSSTARFWNGSEAAHPMKARVRRGSHRSRCFPGERILPGVGASQQLVATANVHRRHAPRRDAPGAILARTTRTSSGDARWQSQGACKLVRRPSWCGRSVRPWRRRSTCRSRRRRKRSPRAPRNNYIDEHVFAKLERLNIEPSGLSSDADFLRRVYLDTIGLVTHAEEAPKSF